MKPRIVRVCAGTETFGTLHEGYSGPAYLALPWPEDCPYTPERVMAACERRGQVPISAPIRNSVGEWVVTIGFLHWRVLTPEFMAEPKKCEHSVRRSAWGSGYATCNECGAILSDRRHGERRRRWVVGTMDVGGRRSWNERRRKP